MNGVDIDIAKLYLPVEFPVSRGTPMIAPFLKWNHDIDHFVPYLNTFIEFSRRNLTINLSDKKFEFIAGHVIDHKVLFPASGWITYVWETYAMMLGKPQSSLSVEMHNVKFLRATVLTSNLDVHVTIVIHRGLSAVYEV